MPSLTHTNIPAYLVSINIIKVWPAREEKQDNLTQFHTFFPTRIFNHDDHKQKSASQQMCIAQYGYISTKINSISLTPTHTLTQLVFCCSLLVQQPHHLFGSHWPPYPDLGLVTLLITQGNTEAQ